ncbi:hypothetical protein SeMB42_g07421 [Synchytrium endobioticum]|uniref:Uncharacterized protein n=1 Tax=Synchytrium endobioticum TaxID=286115 RepID=A0A507C270_9FUNG|nr:hypothetical protein SeMB42_g07421 [Synchytrium endobioticum]
MGPPYRHHGPEFERAAHDHTVQRIAGAREYSLDRLTRSPSPPFHRDCNRSLPFIATRRGITQNMIIEWHTIQGTSYKDHALRSTV